MASVKSNSARFRSIGWHAVTWRNIVASIAIAALALPLAAAPKLYRWTDQDGNVFYSDKVPPEFTKEERHQIDDSGRTKKVLRAQKSPEEIAAEQRQRELERIERELARQQAIADRILLDTYSSADDIVASRDGRIETIKSVIALTENTITGLRKELEKRQHQAASLERAGQEVSEKLLEEIRISETQIQAQLNSIEKLNTDIAETTEEFGRKLARYREIKPE